eukprot:scaffold67772_cov35-Tisochrysis_lutea.AAC.1
MALSSRPARAEGCGASAAAHFFAQRGFCLVEGLLRPEQLELLRDECDELKVGLERRGGDLSEEQCVLDVPPQGVPPEADPARTDSAAYLQYRAFRQERAAAGKGSSDPIAELILQILPAAAARALGCNDYERQQIRLFNEHYVVKPAKVGGRFDWHTDIAHQQEAAAALLSSDPVTEPLPEYISVWCPLDDVTEANGCLVLLPKDAPQPPDASPDLPASDHTRQWLEKAPESVHLHVCAGTAVLFSSRLWHCSEANLSAGDRRVYYAQYSQGPIGGEASPLSLAVRTRAQGHPP